MRVETVHSVMAVLAKPGATWMTMEEIVDEIQKTEGLIKIGRDAVFYILKFLTERGTATRRLERDTWKLINGVPIPPYNVKVGRPVHVFMLTERVGGHDAKVLAALSKSEVQQGESPSTSVVESRPRRSNVSKRTE